MKKYKHILAYLYCTNIISFGQEKKVEYFIPIEIWYNSSYTWRIPWEEPLDNQNWVKMLNYPFTHLNTVDKLMQEDKKKYDLIAQKVLFLRKSCDSLVRDYVNRSSKIDDWKKNGKEGMYMDPRRSGKNDYWRCVCIPATELINIPHKQKIKVGHVYKYFEPKEFCAKFKRWKLDSLDLAEATYFSIFPLDITPSFSCNNAFTHIEKAKSWQS